MIEHGRGYGVLACAKAGRYYSIDDLQPSKVYTFVLRERKQMKDNELLNVYGAKKSKSGNGWNVKLIQGHGDDKRYYNFFVKNEKVDEYADHIEIEIKKLEIEEKPITADDLPF